MASTKFKCPYCGKEFTRERTLQVHMCEPKRRHLQRDEKWVVNAFMVFQRFYQIHQNNSKPKTYEQFCDSAYYNAFVKFGRYIMHINPLYPEKYIDYVLQSKVKLDHWARDDLYEEYLINTLKGEPVEAALQRSIATMMDWAIFFLKIRLHFQGQATDIEIHANEVLSLKKRLNEIYSKHTGKSVDEIKSALERDNFMTADTAKSFGLIDSVVEKRS